MMQQWADQEEQEHDHFPRRRGDYNNIIYDKRGNDHRNDKSQWDYSGSSWKQAR
jgi:hypothetical protein